jgi:hypothetical protein
VGVSAGLGAVLGGASRRGWWCRLPCDGWDDAAPGAAEVESLCRGAVAGGGERFTTAAWPGSTWASPAPTTPDSTTPAATQPRVHALTFARPASRYSRRSRSESVTFDPQSATSTVYGISPASYTAPQWVRLHSAEPRPYADQGKCSEVVQILGSARLVTQTATDGLNPENHPDITGPPPHEPGWGPTGRSRARVGQFG